MSIVYHVCCNSWNTGNIVHRTVSDILGRRFSKTCDCTVSQLTSSLSVASKLEDPKPPADVRKDRDELRHEVGRGRDSINHHHERCCLHGK